MRLGGEGIPSWSSTRRSTGCCPAWSSPPRTSSRSSPGTATTQCSSAGSPGLPEARLPCTDDLDGRPTGNSSRHPRHERDLPAATQEPVTTPLRPPDLIIQDELHLISGPLGSLVGLYEAAVDLWRSSRTEAADSPRQRPSHPGRPKVVASTATIRRAHEQIGPVRPARPRCSRRRCSTSGTSSSPGSARRSRHPAAGTWGSARTACAFNRSPIRSSAGPRRRADASTRSTAEPITDPYMTLVGYFNACANWAACAALDDDVTDPARPSRNAGLARTCTTRLLKELTSRSVVHATSRHPRPARRCRSPRSEATARASGGRIDVVLATNMISVGVDVPRLGLMVVAGQPKTTAEYIQATSRVGRVAPGLVCHALQLGAPARPLALRDLRALPCHLLPAGRGAVGDAVRRPGGRPRPDRRPRRPGPRDVRRLQRQHAGGLIRPQRRARRPRGPLPQAPRRERDR